MHICLCIYLCHDIDMCRSVSVKCRIGVDTHDSYDELKHFIGTVHQSGVNKFIIHSRKCILKGFFTVELIERIVNQFILSSQV